MQKRFAITPLGVGNPVGARSINEGWELEDGETFIVDDDPTGMVLAEDKASLRRPSNAESLADVKRAKLDEITRAREQAIRRLFVNVKGVNYDANEESHARIERAIATWQRAIAMSDPRAPQTVEWLDADNVPRRLTIEQLMELSAAIWLIQESVVWSKNTALKNRIENARSEAAIREVKWDDGN